MPLSRTLALLAYWLAAPATGQCTKCASAQPLGAVGSIPCGPKAGLAACCRSLQQRLHVFSRGRAAAIYCPDIRRPRAPAAVQRQPSSAQAEAGSSCYAQQAQAEAGSTAQAEAGSSWRSRRQSSTTAAQVSTPGASGYCSRSRETHGKHSGGCLGGPGSSMQM